jgi:hypothetical protein
VEELELLMNGVVEWVESDREFLASIWGAKIRKRVGPAAPHIDEVFDTLKNKGFAVEEIKGK